MISFFFVLAMVRPYIYTYICLASSPVITVFLHFDVLAERPKWVIKRRRNIGWRVSELVAKNDGRPHHPSKNAKNNKMDVFQKWMKETRCRSRRTKWGRRRRKGRGRVGKGGG